MFGVNFLKDRLKLMGLIIKKLVKGGLNAGMNLPKILMRVDDDKVNFLPYLKFRLEW